MTCARRPLPAARRPVPVGRAIAAPVLAVGLLLAAGCGVPTSTGVHVDGPAAEADLAIDNEPQLPPGPDDAESPEQLVEFFLQAAAGDPADAVERLRPFIHSDQRDRWQPEPQVIVVRVDRSPHTPAEPGRVRVRLEARMVGTLSRGMIEPREEPRVYEFDVALESTGSASDEVGVDVGELRYRIVDPPNVVLLSDAALAVDPADSGYLLPSPVYFWDRDRDVLVPDLRWLSSGLAAAARVQAKLEWLLDGPAPWLDSLAPLPGDVDLEGNVVWGEDRLDVTLTPAAGDLDPEALDVQLWWTLRGELRGDRSVWLAIDGQEREVRPADAANPTTGVAPASYVVLDGVIVPYVAPDGSGAEVRFNGFTEEIHTAAISQDGVAALVHPAPDGGYRLSLATGAEVVTTGLTAGSMSRPLWLNNPDGAGLVAADGELHLFRAGDSDPVRVGVPGLNGRITALAAAPDGRRLALIAGGELYVASLVRRDGAAVTVNAPMRLATTADNLAGVAFLQESWLAVAGQRERESLLYELTIDGAFERELPNGDLGEPQTVTNMVGYPGDPRSSVPQRGEIMYEADGRAWRYRYLSRPLPISLDELGVDLDSVSSEPRAPLFVE